MPNNQAGTDHHTIHSCRDCQADYSCQTLGSAMVIIAGDVHRWPMAQRKQAEQLMQNLTDLGWKTGCSCKLQAAEDVVQKLTDFARRLLEEVRSLKRGQTAS